MDDVEREFAQIEGREVSVADEAVDMDGVVQVEDADEEFTVAADEVDAAEVDDCAHEGDDFDFDGVEFDVEDFKDDF